MTEQEWLECTEPLKMLAFVLPWERGAKARVSDRKARLFEVACCRRAWSLVPEGACRDAVEVGERYADGEAGDWARRKARKRVAAADTVNLPGTNAKYAALLTTLRPCRRWKHTTLMSAAVAYAASPRSRNTNHPRYESAMRASQSAEADLARCIFGNPFRSVCFSPSWRTASVMSLGQSVYQDRSLPAGTLEPMGLAVLADALEEAGCAEPSVLAHLRSPGPHTRGCWPVDWAIGKE